MIEDFSVFTEQTQMCAMEAYKIAFHHRHSTIEESHLLLALLECDDDLLGQLFENLSLDVEKLKNQSSLVLKHQKRVAFWKSRNYQFFITPTLKQSIEDSVSISKKLGEENVTLLHIFWGVINSSLNTNKNQSRMAQVFKDNDITAEKVLESIRRLSDEPKDDDEIPG